ncbi:MAG: DUF4430 domain-containing protein [Thaumarchaeota archaeon]|jgi:hypothetical protein|nr:DUF4430 domain-containing protein [Candidatus Geocrenenecus arthurdayi]
MAFLRNKWVLALVCILCWAIAASLLSSYYYYQYTDLMSRLEKSKAVINLGIDYGNGTRHWFNGTMGLTLYDAMLKAGWRVDAEPYGTMGLYVKAINGVEQSIEQSMYWTWWLWTNLGWAHGGSACDKYVLSNGETILWYYSYMDPKTFEIKPPS